VDKATDLKLAEIKALYATQSGIVVDQLLERVTRVNPALHRNFTKA
jgi:hypothetical protein